MSYAYDGEGRRVSKTVGTATTRYVYDAFGQLAAEYASPAPTSVPCTTCYLTADHLGSTRMVTDQAGAVVERRDYFPFGEEMPVAGSVRASIAGYSGDAGQAMKFTGKERDQESGLDYFGARYFSGTQGRFTGADPIMANLLRVINPQRWNMYAYAVNNPLAYTDPDGRDAVAVGLSKQVRGFGHAGIASVHKDGRATYARFGPKNEGRAFDRGDVQSIPLSNLTFDTNHNPTPRSVRKMAEQIASFEGQDPNTVSLAYFKTSESDTAALDAWIQEKDRSENGWYSVFGNNCTDFCLNGLSTGGAITPRQAANASIVPNILLWQLFRSADVTYSAVGTNQKEDVRSRLCFLDENGKQQCQ